MIQLKAYDASLYTLIEVKNHTSNSNYRFVAAEVGVTKSKNQRLVTALSLVVLMIHMIYDVFVIKDILAVGC